ncbi:MAG: stage III sporulation protein AF [Clostridia bacterium]|nr:stage III sporulation protein AF [Clostridia bacterium]
MTGWILSIVGMVLTVTLTEIMLPEGETAKYIKGLISLMVVYVVLIPVPHLLNANLDINSFFNFSSESYQIDSAFIQIIKEDKQSALEKGLEEVFRAEGLDASAGIILGEEDEVRMVLLRCVSEEESRAVELTMRSLRIKEDKIVIHEVST